MSEALSASAKKVQQALEEKGLNCEVKELPSSTRTAQDAAKSIGCKVEQIVKSLVFKRRDTSNAVLVLASGPNRVNEEKVAQLLSEPLDRADADFVRAKTGYAIGGVPPLGHAETIETFIDEDLYKYGEIWAAGGTPNSVFKITADDLEKATGASRICVK